MPTPPPSGEGLFLEDGQVHLHAFPPAPADLTLYSIARLETRD